MLVPCCVSGRSGSPGCRASCSASVPRGAAAAQGRAGGARGRAGGARGRAAAEGPRAAAALRSPPRPAGGAAGEGNPPGAARGARIGGPGGAGVSGVLHAAAGPSSCSGQLLQPVGTWCCEPARFRTRLCRVLSCASHGGVLYYAKTKRLHLHRWWCGRGAFGTGALCVLLAFWKFIVKVIRE